MQKKAGGGRCGRKQLALGHKSLLSSKFFGTKVALTPSLMDKYMSEKPRCKITWVF